MPLEAPNNCWPANLQKFADALANSAKFQALVEAANAIEAAAFIFGRRLTHTRNGHAWTADELAELRHYAMVFGDPATPYGKHGPHLIGGGAYDDPHGATIVAVGRLVPEAELVAHGADRTGLSDEHDRQWQNIVGKLAEEILSWLDANGGPYPVTSFNVTDDYSSRAENAATQGVWQYSELTYTWGKAA
jgi:hypothetical protein